MTTSVTISAGSHDVLLVRTEGGHSASTHVSLYQLPMTTYVWQGVTLQVCELATCTRTPPEPATDHAPAPPSDYAPPPDHAADQPPSGD